MIASDSISHKHFFFFFRAAPTAYGCSQAKCWIRAEAAGLCHSHSNDRSEPVCDLHHSSQQCRILNPLSEARIKPATSWFLVGFVSPVPRWELPTCIFYMVILTLCSLRVGVSMFLLWIKLFPSKFTCWGPNPKYLRTWPYLEVGSLTKLKWSH